MSETSAIIPKGFGKCCSEKVCHNMGRKQNPAHGSHPSSTQKRPVWIISNLNAQPEKGQGLFKVPF